MYNICYIKSKYLGAIKNVISVIMCITGLLGNIHALSVVSKNPNYLSLSTHISLCFVKEWLL